MCLPPNLATTSAHYLSDVKNKKNKNKKQRHHFANKGPYSQSYGLSSSHVQMWKLDHKEGWVLKNSCFWIMMLEKTLESPLDCKDSILQKNLSWIFTGSTDAEAPKLWPFDVKSWLTVKDPDAGKERRQKEKRVAEDDMVGWHHWFNGHEFEQTLEDSEGYCSLCATAHGIGNSWRWCGNWTTKMMIMKSYEIVMIPKWCSIQKVNVKTLNM